MNLYQAFVRNHTPQGTINGLTDDVKRIAQMGFKYLYIMPHYPISQAGRKGTYGSPYAIADYRSVHPQLGTLEDFKALLHEVHQHDMKLLIDIVFNHTGNDHYYVKSNPEYYLLDEHGVPTRKVADWSDITDFDMSNRALWDELIDVLLFWAKLGVDGVRCDVASLIDFDFWKQAKTVVNQQFPQFEWYGESVDLGFLRAIRKAGHKLVNDYELMTVFDGCYNYDLWEVQRDVMKKEKSWDLLAALLNYQWSEKQLSNVKWYFVDNHDQPRALTFLSKTDYVKWLSLILLMPGTGFVYAGSESYQDKDTPLFEKECINRQFDEGLVSLITRLNGFKNQIYSEKVTDYYIQSENEVVTMTLETKQRVYTFMINFSNKPVLVEKSGLDLINNQKFDTILLTDQFILLD